MTASTSALAVWIVLPQLRGSWFSFDRRLKSQQNCFHKSNTKFPSNIAFTKSLGTVSTETYQRVTPCSLGTQNLNITAWSIMAVTFSVWSERHLSHHVCFDGEVEKYTISRIRLKTDYQVLEVKTLFSFLFFSFFSFLFSFFSFLFLFFSFLFCSFLFFSFLTYILVLGLVVGRASKS